MSLISAYKHGIFAHRLALQVSKYLGVTYMPYYVFREGHGSLEPRDYELPEGFTASFLQPGDEALVVGLTGWADAAEMSRRLSAGHVCTVVSAGDDAQAQIAGYTWADLSCINDSICQYELPPGHAYLYDAFIAADFRGAGLASIMRALCYRNLLERGVQGFVSISDQFNTPALKFKRRLGAEPVARYHYLKVGGKVWLNSMAKL